MKGYRCGTSPSLISDNVNLIIMSRCELLREKDVNYLVDDLSTSKIDVLVLLFSLLKLEDNLKR